MAVPLFLRRLWAAAVNVEHHVERALGLTPPADVDPTCGLDVTCCTPSCAPGGPSGGSVLARIPTPGGASGVDPIVGPAYGWLAAWPVSARRALADVQAQLGLDPKRGALLVVMDHESGGDPTAPHAATGTPRGGLIQLTQGARLPGFLTASDVWAVRQMSAADQLRKVVLPFYQRMAKPLPDDGILLLRKNFLPGIASQPADYVLGVREGATGPGGESAEDTLTGGLSRGALYRDNPGFDSSGRGYYTWGDVDAQAAASKARGDAAGAWLRVSGARVPFGSDPAMAGARGRSAAASDPRMGSASPPDVDDPAWTTIYVGGYQVKTTTNPLSKNGQRVPMSFAQLVQLAAKYHALPLTPAVSDARWAQAGKRTTAQPLNDPRGALFNDAAQIASFAQRLGPLSDVLEDGGWKEMVAAPVSGGAQLTQKGPGSMLFYGWRKADGSTIQRGLKSDHDRDWIEYDQFGSLVSRDAIDPDGNAVDLLDIYKAGGNAFLPAPIPDFLASQLDASGGV